VRLDLLRMDLDQCVSEIMGEAGLPASKHRSFQRTRNALEISITDLARSPRNKSGHLHLARVKDRRLVLQKMNWEAVLAAVAFVRSSRGVHIPPNAIRENSLVSTVAHAARAIRMLDDQQVSLLTAVTRIADARIRGKAEETGASVEEITSYFSSKGMDAPADLESRLEDLMPNVLERCSRHPGQRRFTAAY